MADPEPTDALQTDEALSRAENGATEAENALRQDIGRLQQLAGTVQAQFSRLQEEVSKSYSGNGDGDEAFMALLRRCQTTPTPTLQLAAHWDRARMARKAAIEARQKERAGIERALEQFRQLLQKLTEQVANDERGLRDILTARAAKQQQAATPAATPPPTAKKGAPPAARKGPPPAAAPKPTPAAAATTVATAPQRPVAAATPVAQAPTVAQTAAAPLVPVATPAAAPRAGATPAPEPTVPHRRQQTRVKLESAISFESEDNFYTGFSVDISEGGIFVSTVNLLPVGTPVDLTLKLPDGFAADVHGVVRWIRDWNEMTPQIAAGIGIQFVDMPPTTTAHLQKFVTQRDAMFYDGDEL